MAVERSELELSAGGVIYRRRSDGPLEVLVMKDSYGNWGFPKGHIEEGESPLEAAVRECREETGLVALRKIDFIGINDWYFRAGGRIHKYCDYYLFEADASDSAEPQREEGVRTVRWFPPDQALERVTYENARRMLQRAVDRLVAESELRSTADRPGRPTAGAGSRGEPELPLEASAPSRGASDSLRIFMTGATGFVGGHIARLAVDRGHRLRALVRDSGRAGALERLGADLVEGDVTEEQSLEGAVEGCDAVIHLVAIIREKKPRQTFEAVHVGGTENVVEAAQRADVSKFVHMSALGAAPEATTPYHRSKHRAEEVVRQSGLAYTIFRPSIIVGRGSAFVQLIGRLVRFAPVIPVLGDGQYRLQPIDVQDVAHAFLQAAEREDLRAETFDIGGPHKLTYNRLLEIFGEELGHRRGKIHIPMGLARPVVDLVSRLGLPTPINSDELAMMLEENVVPGDRNVLREVFGLDPTSIRSVLQRITHD